MAVHRALSISMFALATLAGGCGTHPCNDHPGETCIEVEVQPAPGADNVVVDRLSVALTAPSLHSKVSGDSHLQSGAAAATLPVKLALLPGNDFSDSFRVDVSAFLNGMEVGRGGVSGTVSAGGHAEVAIVLGHEALVDMGVATDMDMAMVVNPNTDMDMAVTNPPDMPPPHDAFLPPDGFPSHLGPAWLKQGLTCDIEAHDPIDTDNTDIGQTNYAALCKNGNGTGIITEPGNIQVRVYAVRNFHVPKGETVHLVGSNGFAIVATESIVIDGILEASADLNVPGAGGDYGTVGESPLTAGMHMGPGNGDPSLHLDSGGGGGGFGTPGGKGGAVSYKFADGGVVTVPGGQGATIGGEVELKTNVPGGAPGGAFSGEMISICPIPDPGQTNRPYNGGGGGGGSIQLSAGGSIIINGEIRVNGGGGLGGCFLDDNNGLGRNAASGAGGGSGGAIFLESKSISLGAAAVLSANGGGGGGGADFLVGQNANSDGGVGSGKSGANGPPSAVPAQGGKEGGPAGGRGGNGASGTAMFGTEGKSVSGDPDGNGGGGGGGAGRIVVRVPSANALSISQGAVVSPPVTERDDL